MTHVMMDGVRRLSKTICRLKAPEAVVLMHREWLCLGSLYLHVTSIILLFMVVVQVMQP